MNIFEKALNGIENGIEIRATPNVSEEDYQVIIASYEERMFFQLMLIPVEDILKINIMNLEKLIEKYSSLVSGADVLKPRLEKYIAVKLRNMAALKMLEGLV